MNLHLSIAFSLLALVAGMYLLAKTRSENLGKLFSFISWLVVIVAGINLVCQLAWGGCMLACHTGICTPSEHCMPGMMHGGGMHSDCDEMEEGCGEGHGGEMGGHRDCCKGNEEGKGGCMEEGDKEKECDHDHEMKSDSSHGK